MKKIGKITLLITLILLIVGNCAFASDSISAMAYCRVPYIIKLSDQADAIAEEEIAEQNSISQTQENIGTLSSDNSNTIQQQEEAVSENSQETEIINTVCAR
jgi:hypothetical protein